VEKDAKVVGIIHLLVLCTGAACQVPAPSRVRYNLSTGRSSLGRSILSVRFSEAEKSGLEEDRTSYWLVVWPSGGAPPESGLRGW
jgi:hypothetical protein